jgi:phosphatidylserine/phosphatidylglycerophosphate/cardiolipin synthase-like enzyme
VAAALGRALARGVEVKALLEGAPVGGRPPDEAGIVSALVARGASISFLGGAPGFPARYPTLHAKTIVVDRERALLSTDNFHAGFFPATPGAESTRGYGVVIANASFAARLASVIDADLVPWPDVHPDAGDAPPAVLAPGAGGGEGPSLKLEGAWVATLVLSPDNGASNATLLRMIHEARTRIDAEELFADARFRDAPNPFLDALVDAARRNVTVRLLLDGRVDDGRNRAVAEALATRAAREGLPLEVRVDASGRTLHAKAVVADDSLYVGSMNWGRASATENREAGVILWNATDAAAWMRARMDEDWGWRPATPRETPGPAPLLAVAAAWLIRRRG